MLPDNKLWLPDIDECLNGTHTCQEDATCNNTIGWYNCTCNPGFDGNGKNCTGKFYDNWLDGCVFQSVICS